MRRNTSRWLSFALALCLCLTLFSLVSPKAAAETGISKVLLQTGNGGTTPVVWMELQYLPTNTSTNGVTIQSANWYKEGGEQITGRFEGDTCYLVAYVAANEGFVFTDDVMVFINGSQASCSRESDTLLKVTSHSYKPEIWAAAVYKNPTGETVQPGGAASFVTAGGYVQDFEWCLMTPDKQHRFSLKEAKEECQVVSRPALIPKDFVNVQTDGDFKDTLTLRNIPADLNGFYVYCRLYSYNRITWSNTEPALLTVIQPSPSPTPEPSPSASPSPTPEPEHVHEAVDLWSSDEEFHWHACKACDEQLDKAEHEMTWTEISPAALGAEGEEEGVCGICGYKATRAIPALEPEQGTEDGSGGMGIFHISGNAFRTIILGIFGVTGLGLLTLVITAAVKRGRRRR